MSEIENTPALTEPNEVPEWPAHEPGDGGRLYLEWNKGEPEPKPSSPGWRLVKRSKRGKVHSAVYEKDPPP